MKTLIYQDAFTATKPADSAGMWYTSYSVDAKGWPFKARWFTNFGALISGVSVTAQKILGLGMSRYLPILAKLPTLSSNTLNILTCINGTCNASTHALDAILTKGQFRPHVKRAWFAEAALFALPFASLARPFSTRAFSNRPVAAGRIGIALEIIGFGANLINVLRPALRSTLSKDLGPKEPFLTEPPLKETFSKKTSLEKIPVEELPTDETSHEEEAEEAMQ